MNWEFKVNLNLLKKMARRDIASRYRGSVFGLLWSLLLPLLMLTIYTFVFSVVFGARWGEAADKVDFALNVFVGLMLYQLFTESFNLAPRLIISNTNYVKKVVFPLQILPLVNLCTGLFHLSLSFLVWLVFYAVAKQELHLTLLFFPLLLLPFLAMILGVVWFISSLSVYLRDIAQTTSIISTALLFMSPIFYPISALPEKFHFFVQFNPLTFVISEARKVLILGIGPDWIGLALYSAVGFFVAYTGYWWFMKAKKGFADVL